MKISFRCKQILLVKIPLAALALVLFPLPSYTREVQAGYLKIVFKEKCQGRSPASFHSAGEFCITDPLSSDSSTRFIDLLRLIFPDLQEDGVYQKLSPEAEAFYQKQESRILRQEKIGAVSFLTFNEGDRKLKVFLIDAKPFIFLALVETAPPLHLLDLRKVDPDHAASFDSRLGIVSIHPEHSGFFVVNRDLNPPNISLIHYSFFAPLHGKLRPLYHLPLLYLREGKKSASDQSCTRVQSPVFTPLNKTSKSYYDLNMKVEEIRICKNAKGSREEKLKEYTARLVWDEKLERYEGGSKELQRVNQNREIPHH